VYTLSPSTDRLYIQNPPNSGAQTSPIAVTKSGAPLDFDAATGFDIPPGVDAPATSAPATGLAYATLTVGGASSLHTINLTTGEAREVGTIHGGAGPIKAPAVQGEVLPDGYPAVALSSDGSQLLRFNTANPGTGTGVGIAGMVGGEVLVGIDW